MAFQGPVLSVAELLDAANAAPPTAPSTAIGVRHTAAQNAVACQTFIVQGESLDSCWRFCVLQTLDDYSSTHRRGGSALAGAVFAEEPIRTGAPQIDAALAALAEYLALRDGWQARPWVHDPSRRTSAWYPGVPSVFRPEADRDSPEAFKRRGIFITSRSLARA